jgi:hypothetical protein
MPLEGLRVRIKTGAYRLACGAIGILAGIVGISLLVTMAYTILLIPVSLLGVFMFGGGGFPWLGEAGQRTGQVSFSIFKAHAQAIPGGILRDAGFHAWS